MIMQTAYGVVNHIQANSL